MKDISYKIAKNIAVLSCNSKGWTVELNEVSWNGAPAKLDVRHWDPEHTRPHKGITLSIEEAAALHKALGEVISGV